MSHISQAPLRTKTARIPNAVRTRVTRAAILDATIEAIVTYGYQGATSARIAELSHLTRGAQKHHFDTKAKLLTAALVDVQSRYLAAAVAELRQTRPRGIYEILEVLWESLLTDLAIAVLDLRVAARIDDELREALIPADREIGERALGYVVTLLDDGTQPADRLHEIAELAFNTLRGMSLQRLLAPNEVGEHQQLRLLEESVRALLAASADCHSRSG